MITDAIITIAQNVVAALVNVLPNSSGFDPQIISAATTIGGYAGMFSPIVPMSTLAVAVGIGFSVEIAVFGWKTIKSLVSHLPWVGGAGH